MDKNLSNIILLVDKLTSLIIIAIILFIIIKTKKNMKKIILFKNNNVKMLISKCNILYDLLKKYNFVVRELLSYISNKK
jgi:hypothetical protein